MVIKADTYTECPKCKGTGVAQTQKGPENPCKMCQGLGGLKSGFVDITMMIEKIKEKK
jgi:DnaJ-class molecular chaperone